MLAELHDAYPVYRWYPDMLINSTHSAENLAYQLRDHLAEQGKISRDDLATYIREKLIEQGLGVYDATDEEINRLVDNSDPWPASYIFADIISRRAQVGWSTHGHSGNSLPPLKSEHSETESITAADVNIYASSPKHARPLIGNHENTEVGDFLREYLDVDTEAVTEELKEQLATLSRFKNWLGKPIDETKTMADLDHYQGDFKRNLECGCGAVH